MHLNQVHVYAVQADGNFVPRSPAAEATPYTTPDIVTFLTRLTPYSLPILRRLQLGPKNGKTLFVATPLPLNGSIKRPGTSPSSLQPEDVWTMAFIDRAGWPSTEIWPFSSLELLHGTAPHETIPQKADFLPDRITLPFSPEICSLATSQLLAILSHVEITHPRVDNDPMESKKASEGTSCVLAGNVHSTVAALLSKAAPGLVVQASVPYGKYFFPATPSPQSPTDAPLGSSTGLPEGLGLVWSVMASEKDWADVMAVNSIIRNSRTLANLPNVAIRETALREGRKEGKAIAFAFAAGDGSIRTLHVDTEYRRKGFAKKVVRRLIDMGALMPPREGLLAPRVEEEEVLGFCGIAEENESSIRTFQGVGGVWRWDVYWLPLDLERLPRGV